MRVTAIPAQITTVEDRIVGSLNLGQLLLLCTPVFGGGLLYAILPPVVSTSAYKVILMVILGTICGTCAIRVKGQIMLSWAIIFLHYWLRPRYYVFDKCSLHCREQYLRVAEGPQERLVTLPERSHKKLFLSPKDKAKVQEFIESPAANVAFDIRKGGVYVRITEIK